MGITKLIPWMKEIAPAAFHAEETPSVPNVFVFDAAGGLHRALRARNQKSSLEKIPWLEIRLFMYVMTAMITANIVVGIKSINAIITIMINRR